MENRQYSHEFQGLEKAVYREITPSILDVPPIRKGFNPIRKATGSRFGIALNMFLFKELEVEFRILDKRFLCMTAYHKARKFAGKMMCHRCVYYFFIPSFVDTDRIVVEWYKDHCVYIRERRPAHSNIFGPSDDEDEDDIVPQSSSSREKKSMAAEDASEDIAPQTTEKDSELDEALSTKESLTVECGSERDLAEVSIEEEPVPDEVVSIVKVSSRAGSSSEDCPQPEESGKESLEEAGPSEKESQPSEATSGEEKQAGESLESSIREIGKLFRETNLAAAGNLLKREFVDRNYKPDSGALDVERLLDELRISNRSFQRNFVPA